ncbi:class I mannose-6-phosphate isomerase [Spirosoma sp. RP8]|uniref:Class I mannose-6-phosphate isomerase n=1 Tax=Spirosoma liriopis TaxID=2937440 RepID=A0ABT0HRJ7_9BACT|nr:class I mannose-6-phosphate isomerase [Spirosoma liriopis]MCK8494757.1 class I mannose-6-phosphate isomerase [Spirosoma liriopis]
MTVQTQSTFDKYPAVSVEGETCLTGWEAIASTLRQHIQATGKPKIIVAVDTYLGVYIDEVIAGLSTLSDQLTVIETGHALRSPGEIDELVNDFVTDDPVFGHVCPFELSRFYDEAKLATCQQTIQAVAEGVVLVVGTGAALFVDQPDVLVYADMPRWEIQLRFRQNRVNNLGAQNADAVFAYQYKRSFYVDWKVLDRHKKNFMERWDYMIDTTREDTPKLISGTTLQKAMALAVRRPFRVVPFFDPGPWGGQWLKEICDLDRSVVNYAWGFDCVPEENSLLFNFDGETFEIPSIDVVFSHPVELLGEQVYAAFGAEFPIRFDFLDTIEGGNLSLQVHPLHEYMREQFGMPYTQNESYYFLEAKEDACVYLGLKEDIHPAEMIADLEKAQEGEAHFDADQYVEKWPIKKHDHALIPAGTVHCSGANSVVLEISATPFNFTFKLWDWGRTGLDGKPRPISLEHGKKNIQWDRTSQWTEANLLNQIQEIGRGDGWREERTGLDEDSFIETRRHWFSKTVAHDTKGVVNVINLIEGDEATVESPSNAFEPFVVHYAETFIVPAAVGTYTIKPSGVSEGREIGTLKAYIRTEKLTDHPLK